MQCREPGHVGESFSSKCSIYGGFEGICVALVALSAAYSQHTSCDPGSVLSLGTAVMVPLAIAFGAREYIRCRSNHEHWQRERDREQWELENNPDGEIKEMVEIYTDPRWGVSAKDATLAVRTLAKYPKLFVDMMMHQELEIPRPEGNPLSAGLSTTLAFLGFGSFPIAVYAFMLTHPVEPLGAGSLQYHIVVSLFAALLPSVLLGVAKFKWLPQRRRLWMHAALGVTCCVAGLLGFLAARATPAAVTATTGLVSALRARECPWNDAARGITA